MRPSDLQLAWLRLALAEGVGPATAGRLCQRLGGACEAAQASTAHLRAVGARPHRAAALARALRKANPERVWHQAAALGQRVLTPADERWPQDAFQALHAPPLVLFVRGRLPPPEARRVAIVGSRSAGSYGLRMARQIAEDLAGRGVWILSGLAVGVDAAAHGGALAREGGRTLAFLGCGADVPYPLEHVDLKEAVVSTGGVAAEHPPGTPPSPGQFPRRNRLVAALAEAVVVVEAGARSGALNTAYQALDLGRDILAVPGPVGGAHRGSLRLLKTGAAAMCERAADVFGALKMGDAASDGGASRSLPAPPAGPQLAVWTALPEDEMATPDALRRRTGLGLGEVTQALAMLEIDGYVKRVPGVGVRRTS